MKTAFQELKEWVIKNREHQQGSESGEQAVCDFEYCDFEELIMKIDTLMVKEMFQIEDAFNEGMMNNIDYFDPSGNGLFEYQRYYKETYKNI